MQIDERGTSRPSRSQSSSSSVDAHAPGNGEQMHHRIGRAADGAVDADGVLEGLRRQNLRHAQILAHHLDDAPTGHMRQHKRRDIDGGNGGIEGRPMPSASTMLAMVEAVPMVMQWPAERDMQALGRHEIVQRHLAGRHILAELPDIGARADVAAAEFAVQHRAAGDAMVGRSQLAAPISSAGVVLSQPTSSTTPSIGLPRIDSSTSMLARLRNSMAVGRICVSPSDITGNSSGRPPAS